MNEIQSVDVSKVDTGKYSQQLADCIVLTRDGRLCLQMRPDNWGTHAGAVCLFGGHVEEGESPEQAVIREIQEELGASIKSGDLKFIGAVTEDWTNHTELVHIYFWQDTQGTITGCYEGEVILFDTIADAMAHPKLMAYAKWALEVLCANTYSSS